jgi:endonuclease/exonuclease/phosphatase family metal-dependent hydrolase
MAGIIRKFTRQFFITCNVFVSVCMLLLYILPYSDQNWFWMLNLIALAFPFLMLIQIGFFVFWLFAKPKLAWLPFISLVLCFGQIKPVLALSSFKKNRGAEAFSFASWNVHLLNFFEGNGKLDDGMMQQAKKINADVLAVQEFVFSTDTGSSMSLQAIRKKLGYKYVVAGNDRAFGVYETTRENNKIYNAFCVAIFSNYPVLQWKKIQSLREYNHTFIWADILVGADTIRFFNIHLQSMHFAKKDYEFIENIDHQGVEEVQKTGRNLLLKLKNANLLRAIQVKEVEQEIMKSPHPVILAGDFNDVPNSYAYQTISKHLKDAFVTRGFGLGRTFRYLSPTLRIDFIFYSKSLPVLKAKILPVPLSDHLPVRAEFEVAAQ